MLTSKQAFDSIESYTEWVEYEKNTSRTGSEARVELHAKRARWIRGFQDLLEANARSV